MAKSKTSVEDRDNPALSVDSFRAELDVFSGPLDLLLYLIKREEVDILEIPVSHITDQYLAAMEAFQAFDVNMAAEFLVMAATLMDIKSRCLLPDSLEEEEDDPRDDLVKQLLQYRRFKRAADNLEKLAEKQSLKWPRVPPPVEEEEGSVGLEELLNGVSLWDLVSVYAEVIRQIETAAPRNIVYDDVPVSEYMEEVMDVVERRDGEVRFLDFFHRDRSRGRIIGIFLALLELLKQSRVRIGQSGTDDGDIVVYLHGDTEYEEKAGG
jgi:segregation and condensation protein A